MTADAASLAVAGIIFVPPVVWTPVGAGAETKFQCSGIVNTAYDEVTFLSTGWSGTLSDYLDDKIKLAKDITKAPIHTITVTLKEVGTEISGLQVTCYVQKQETSLKLDWVMTTFKTITMNPMNPRGSLTTYSGDTMTFSCSVNGPPPTSFKWEKTIDSVKTELTNAVTTGTSSTLTLTDITKTTAMNCYAVYDYTATDSSGLTQIKGSAVLTTDTNKATVLAVAGLPVLTVTPDQTEFWDGQTNVIIKCETTETTFTSLALQKDNEEPEVVAINNVQISIAKVTLNSAGTYKCILTTAKDSEVTKSDTFTKSVQIVVHPQCDTTEVLAKQKDPKYSFTFDATKYPFSVNITCAAGYEYISQSSNVITCLTTGIWNIVGPDNPEGTLGNCVKRETPTNVHFHIVLTTSLLCNDVESRKLHVENMQNALSALLSTPCPNCKYTEITATPVTTTTCEIHVEVSVPTADYPTNYTEKATEFKKLVEDKFKPAPSRRKRQETVDWKVTSLADGALQNECPTGYGTSLTDNTKCVECQKGTVQSGTECAVCPQNQFMNMTRQAGECHVCPEGTETFSSRSDSVDDCIKKCTIPTLHYATTSPVAGTVVANGTGVVVLCKSGYVFDKTDAFTTSICNIDTNKLPDCHSVESAMSANYLTINTPLTKTCTVNSAVPPSHVQVTFNSSRVEVNHTCANITDPLYKEELCVKVTVLGPENMNNATGVSGMKYVYEHKIEKAMVNNSGTYACQIKMGENWFNLTKDTVNVYSINITSKKEPVQVHGTENTLSCVADHPKVSEESTVKISWYKSTDLHKAAEEFKQDQEVLSTLKVAGNWEDSAPFRCLFEYSDPYIKPTFSEPISLTYVGIYRSSMYRFLDQGEIVVEDQLFLTKLDNANLDLSLYFQTVKKDTITGATCSVTQLKEGTSVVPNTATEGEGTVTIATLGGVTMIKDNSPFETASRWKVTVPLITRVTSSVGKDVFVKCEYTFSDAAKSTQFATFVVKTFGNADAAAAYAKTWPSDFMVPYSEVEQYLTKSATVWNTQLATNHYNVDLAYSTAGLLSTTPATKYANFAKVYANLHFKSISSIAADGITTVKLSSDYGQDAVYKDISTYHSIVLASSTALAAGKYLAAPSYVAYMPTIQTNNGTKVYATVGSTITLTCSINGGIVQVTWFKETTELTGWHSYYKRDDKRVYTKLILEDLKTTSQGTYSCAAGLVSQTDNLWPVKHEIALFVVAAEMHNAYAPLGQAVTLTCSMPTSQKPDEVLWYGNGKLLTGSDTIVYDTANNKVLSLYALSAVTASQFGTYKAVAYFDRFTTEAHTNEAMLYELKITQAPIATLGIEGQTMTLFCNAAKPEGFTDNIAFIWYKDGQVNVPSSEQTTTDTASTKNNVLKIFALKAENTGQYKCKVTYFADGRYSLETSQVQASLIDAQKMPENTYAITGSSATLSCVMKAAGAEAKVDWYFKGIQLVKSNLTELHSYDQESSTTTSLRYIRHMSEANAGLYQAKITYGTLTLELQATVTHLKFLELSTSVPLPVEFNTYYITCQFTGIAGAAVPSITWFKDNKAFSKIENGYINTNTQNNITSSEVVITLANSTLHDGVYNCSATYDDVKPTFGGTLKSPKPKDVTVLYTIDLVAPTTSKKGESITMKCRGSYNDVIATGIQGNGSAYHFRWFFGEEIIQENSNSITNNKSIIESVYVINDSTGANNGTYSCKAIYTMNGEDFPGKLLSTEVFVEEICKLTEVDGGKWYEKSSTNTLVPKIDLTAFAGKVLYLVCNDSYTNEGPPFKTCLPGGNFSDELNCIKKPDSAVCPNIKTSEEGSSSCEDVNGTFTCTFNCTTGVIYNGESLKNGEVKTCNKTTKLWSEQVTPEAYWSDCTIEAEPAGRYYQAHVVFEPNVNCAEVPDFPAQLNTFFTSNKDHYKCIKNNQCALMSAETKCANNTHNNTIQISFTMSQLVTMSDESIFVAFKEALSLHITIGVFVLTKSESRKRAATTVTATTFVDTSWIDCEDGWGRVEERCVKCPAGYKSDKETRYPCVICPSGTYTEEPGQDKCTACPAGTSTPSEGATSATMCDHLCNIPSINNGNTFPFFNFNVTADQNVTITCNANPADSSDSTYYALEFGQENIVRCNSTKLPDCYRTCSLTALPPNQVFLGSYKVGDTIRFKERIGIKCSDKSTVFATCESQGAISIPTCGSTSEEEPSASNIVWVVVAVSVSGLVVAALIILTATIVKKRREAAERAESDVSKSIALATNIYSGQEQVVLSRPFDAKAFVMHVQEFSANNNEKFLEDFANIPHGDESSKTAGQQEENLKKNRYQNVIPYDLSRVKLTLKKNVPYSEYINASFINGYTRPKEYIVTQNPLNNTKTDFWRMAYEYRSFYIICLCDGDPDSPNKCAKYWPDEEYTYGNLRVSLLTDTLYPNFIERTFELLPTGSSTAVTVKQYHLTNWRGPVPDQAAFIDFMYYTRFLTKDRREPVLIHSPSGSDYAGVYVAIDYTLDRLCREDTINVLGVTSAMRTQRVLMIQNELQYIFVHKIIAKIINNKHFENLRENRFKFTLRKIKEINNDTIRWDNP